ncbi:MAG: endopeptidase La, partial [Bacilli bacterium]
RATVLSLEEMDEGRVTVIPFQEQPEDETVRLYKRVLLEAFEEYVRISQKMKSEVYFSIESIEDASELVDSITTHLSLGVKEKLKLLETFDLQERMQEVVTYLKEQKELVKLDKRISVKVKRAIEKTQKDFYLREQMKAIKKELGDYQETEDEVGTLRKKLRASGMPEQTRVAVEKEINRYSRLNGNSQEASFSRNYIEWMLNLPWSSKTEDVLDTKRAAEVLDAEHYGLETVKERILEYLAVRELNGTLRGPILCLVGPPGVGKTTLARSIATSLNRKFVRVSLGGVRDESEIRGHRRTYIGSMPGRIIQGMKRASTINPVFLLDEIDKMGNDFRGDPASAMLEVLDPDQNHSFSDHYIEEPYDLSQVMFVATANSLATIPGPLRDRMEIISLGGYTELEKEQIARNYLLPKQIKENGLKTEQLTLRKDALQLLVRQYTREAGVRNLERVLGNICRKAALQKVRTKRERMTVTSKTVTDWLGAAPYAYGKKLAEPTVGVAMGLAYTTAGGDVLPIEVSFYPGKGAIHLTGKLGDVMKESARIALSYVRQIARDYGIEPRFFQENDLHIHAPEGAVPKDGPSAGITLALAILSSMTGRKVESDIGMTGEISLRGRVLPIGGLKEKALAAHRAGIARILYPADNEKDVRDIPQEVRRSLELIPVTHVSEVFEHALLGE